MPDFHCSGDKSRNRGDAGPVGGTTSVVTEGASKGGEDCIRGFLEEFH